MKNHFHVATATLLVAACVVPAQASARAIKNIATVYTTKRISGTGEEFFTIPTIKPGFYQVSYSATFHPAGSPSAPVIFYCAVLQNDVTSIATATSAYASGVIIGLNGLTTVEAAQDDSFRAYCGRNDGDAWTFVIPLSVTFLRIDDLSHVTIP